MQVPALIVVACLFYEQGYFDHWMVTWHMDMCSRHNSYSIPCPLSRDVGRKPDFEVRKRKLLFLIFSIMYTIKYMSWSLGYFNSVESYFNLGRF